MRTINLNHSQILDDLTTEIETNLNGPIRMIQKFLPHLKTKPTAAIVNVTSGLAFVPLPTSPIYCAPKPPCTPIRSLSACPTEAKQRPGL